jgi:hypothetical protein
MNDINDDDLLDFIETHRAAYAFVCKAEDEYNAAETEDGVLSDAMHAACSIEPRLYDAFSPASRVQLTGWRR